MCVCVLVRAHHIAAQGVWFLGRLYQRIYVRKYFQRTPSCFEKEIKLEWEVFCIACWIYLISWSNRAEVKTQRGRRAKFKLGDGSELWPLSTTDAMAGGKLVGKWKLNSLQLQECWTTVWDRENPGKVNCQPALIIYQPAFNCLTLCTCNLTLFSSFLVTNPQLNPIKSPYADFPFFPPVITFCTRPKTKHRGKTTAKLLILHKKAPYLLIFWVRLSVSVSLS